MNKPEVIRLCGLIKTLIPHQAFDAQTPLAWLPILADVTMTDAQSVVRTLAGEQPYIAVSDIVKGAKRIRADRLAHAETIVPNVDPDDVAAYIRVRRQILAQAAAGAVDAELGRLAIGSGDDAADAERLTTILETAVALPRIPDAERADLTAAERAAHERVRLEQLAALGAAFPEVGDDAESGSDQR